MTRMDKKRNQMICPDSIAHYDDSDSDPMNGQDEQNYHFLSYGTCLFWHQLLFVCCQKTPLRIGTQKKQLRKNPDKTYRGHLTKEQKEQPQKNMKKNVNCNCNCNNR